jgi:hypothetical protein
MVAKHLTNDFSLRRKEISMQPCNEIETKLAEAMRLIPANGVGGDLRSILSDVLDRRSDDPVRDLQSVAGALTGFAWWAWGKNAKQLVMEVIEAQKLPSNDKTPEGAACNVPGLINNTAKKDKPMFKLEISTENEAFRAGDRAVEVADILEGIAERLRQGVQRGKAMDSNGNRVARGDSPTTIERRARSEAGPDCRWPVSNGKHANLE